MDDHIILGVHLTNRVKDAPAVQKVLTTNGTFIKTRLGLHEVAPANEAAGLILLELIGGESAAEKLVEELSAIDGVDIQQMVFAH